MVSISTPARDAAKLQSNLTQVLLSSGSTEPLLLFVQGEPVPLEGLRLFLDMGLTVDNGAPGLSASLVYGSALDPRRSDLFPGCLEVTGQGRRLVVSCANTQSLDEAQVTLGLDRSGCAVTVNGLARLTLLFDATGATQATLAWTDGTTETLFDSGLMPGASESIH